jgi:hypothetical protein
MSLSPKADEDINNCSLKKSTNIPKNYSKKNISKLAGNKNQFSRNQITNSNKNHQSFKKIIPNPISINSTSNNSSLKNLTNSNLPINKYVGCHHKKSESSINFISFINKYSNTNSNMINKNKISASNINENPKINNSFINEYNNNENNICKEIFVNKIETKKIITRNKEKNKEKTHQDKKSSTSHNNDNTTTYKIKIGDNKKIIKLQHSPNEKMKLNSKSIYYSKNISPTAPSRNIIFKSPTNNLIVDGNPIIKTYYKKINTENTYYKNKNNNFNGSVFAIHKMLENSLFKNKLGDNIKNNIPKNIDLKKNFNVGVGISKNLSYNNNTKKKVKSKSNINNDSLNIPSNLIIFSSNQSSYKNCLYKNTKYNKKSKNFFSQDKTVNESKINKSYNSYNNHKKSEFINIYNINSINKFDNSLHLKIENNFKNFDKENKKINSNDAKGDFDDIAKDKIEKIKKIEIIYPSKSESDMKSKNTLANSTSQNDNSTPEESHFQLISFIQNIKNNKFN